MLLVDPAPKVNTPSTLKFFNQKVERKTVEDKVYKEKKAIEGVTISIGLMEGRAGNSTVKLM